MITIRYFAWLREKIGHVEEQLELTPDLATVGDVAEHLAARGGGYAEAFANPNVVRAALDRRHVASDTAIATARELAFFPPVTGG
jgi:sulfur-carrier protein